MIFRYHLRGLNTCSGETTQSFSFCFPSKKGVCSKWKEFAPPLGANSFLLEKIPFKRGTLCRKANRKSQKLPPLQIVIKMYQVYHLPLKNKFTWGILTDWLLIITIHGLEYTIFAVFSECNSWHSLEFSKIPVLAARYGHTAQMYRE